MNRELICSRFFDTVVQNQLWRQLILIRTLEPELPEKIRQLMVQKYRSQHSHYMHVSTHGLKNLIKELASPYRKPGYRRTTGQAMSCGTQDVKSPSHGTMRGMCSITAEAASIIFQAKNDAGRQKQDKLATRLAAEFNISPKAVRDIWCLRTWAHATRQHWTLADEQQYLRKQLCAPCVSVGVSSAKQACPSCRRKTSSVLADKAKQSKQEIAQWMIDPAVIAQEFDALLQEWEHSSARRDCCVHPKFEPCCDARFIEREIASARWDCSW